ncbi:hypothetical protein [Nocardia cyriacigeorgica]|nr:hypothetical protein [Nocardia cyriacigeorgica]
MANAVAARLDAHGFELRRYNCTTAAIDGPAIVCASAAQAAEEAVFPVKSGCVAERTDERSLPRLSCPNSPPVLSVPDRMVVA